MVVHHESGESGVRARRSAGPPFVRSLLLLVASLLPLSLCLSGQTANACDLNQNGVVASNDLYLCHCGVPSDLTITSPPLRRHLGRFRCQRELVLHRSEEHTSELQSHSFISYAVF